MTPEAAYQYLLDLPRFSQDEDAARPGLERIEGLLDAMGHPERAFRSLHIAGTNGKGSTAAMLAAMLMAGGHRTGLHVSPHMFEVGERLRVDGKPASLEWIAGEVERWKDVFEEVRPSFFEALVALSFRRFAAEAVDWAVVEVGLGGRWDATNVLNPHLCLITHIGLDHRSWLGDTIAEIAREKAGIIKEGVPVCVGPLKADALRVIRAVASEKNAPLHEVSREVTLLDGSQSSRFGLETPEGVYRNLELDLIGTHQRQNAQLAVRGLELIWEGTADDRGRAVWTGLARVRELTGMRGRFDILQVEPLVIADVAHNPEGLEVTLQALEARYDLGERDVYVVLGVLQDKDVRGMVRLLDRIDGTVIPVQPDSARALALSDLRAVLWAEGVSSVDGGGDLFEAVRWFQGRAQRDDILLITGTHGVVASILQEYIRNQSPLFESQEDSKSGSSD